MEVAIAGLDETGVRRTFSIQRSTDEPEEQDVQYGMDSYCVSTERGATLYGCLSRVRLDGVLLTLEFTAEDAEILEISPTVVIDLHDKATGLADLPANLRRLLDWGATAKRPELRF
ncbi:Imm10 family immunity protein [Lentzea sp. NPDC051838]|uniref:Imm10 family immunity protein n=1 Tax=Lentzea sp. NPDC051838 TaxID=3154849 RepID=UPI00343F6DC9